MTDQNEMLGRDETLAEFEARRGTGAKFVTYKNVVALIEGSVLPAIAEAIKDHTHSLLQRIVDLELRLVEIEAKGVEYKGVHQKATEYRRGSLVTADGSLFAAIRDTVVGETPGDASGAFQLVAKRGRDGRPDR